jgi:hypothetical protein
MMLPLLMSVALWCGGYQALTVDSVHGSVAVVECRADGTLWDVRAAGLREGPVFGGAEAWRTVMELRRRIPVAPGGDLSW